MIPVTGFESSGGSRITSRLEERAFLSQIASETQADLEVAGYSPLGYPIWAASIGTGPSIMVCSNVHPREPSGREATLMWFRDLAYSTDPSITAYLAAHRVVIIPNILVDRMSPAERLNVNGWNLNRDYFSLTQPETRAVARIVQREHPVMIMDMHQVSGSEETPFRPHYITPEQTYQGALDLGEELVDIMAQRLLDHDPSWTTELYTQSLVPWGQLATAANAWNAVGILNEAAYLGLSTATTLQRITLDTMRDFHEANTTELVQVQADSRQHRMTEPIRVPTHEMMYRGDEVYVDPGQTFTIDGDVPTELFDLHGIEYDGYTVSMDQPAQRLVAYLLAPESREYIENLAAWDRDPEGEPLEPLEPEPVEEGGAGEWITRGHLTHPATAVSIQGHLTHPTIVASTQGHLVHPASA